MRRRLVVAVGVLVMTLAALAACEPETVNPENPDGSGENKLQVDKLDVQI